MKNILLGTLLFVLTTVAVSAQTTEKIYATMDSEVAETFKARYPDDIEIIASTSSEAAVLMSADITKEIYKDVNTHGPGFIFQDSELKALLALEKVESRRPLVDFNITEDALVYECLDIVDADNIENDILDLQDYGTRYHLKPEAIQAVLDQQAKWDAMILASGRSDISTRIYNHVNTPMPSVILTMTGADNPDEFVIIGGHIDSINPYNNDDAPGADDNASGIAALNEIVRVLLEKEFVPSRTVEVMAYAAEEVGLVGSEEIAQDYANNDVDVLAYVQFDMTGYKGSVEDIYITQDSYNSVSLNNYLVTLMDHYNSSGAHSFSYGFTTCGYGCSDHASWANNGYEAAFPFEAKMGQDNPNIHSSDDVYSFFNTPDHAVKFAKLGLEFIIEAAKPALLSIEDFSENAINLYVKDKILRYNLNNKYSDINSIHVFNALGQEILVENNKGGVGSLEMQQYPLGFYIVKFGLENNQILTKKFILN